MTDRASGGIVGGDGPLWGDDGGCDYIIPMTRSQYDRLMRPEADKASPLLVELVRRVRADSGVRHDLDDVLADLIGD